MVVAVVDLVLDKQDKIHLVMDLVEEVLVNLLPTQLVLVEHMVIMVEQELLVADPVVAVVVLVELVILVVL